MVKKHFLLLLINCKFNEDMKGSKFVSGEENMDDACHNTLIIVEYIAEVEAVDFNNILDFD